MISILIIAFTVIIIIIIIITILTCVIHIYLPFDSLFCFSFSGDYLYYHGLSTIYIPKKISGGGLEHFPFLQKKWEYHHPN